MYNNSNGSVEHGDPNPSQKETEPPAELTDVTNEANEDKPAESECKEHRLDEGEVEEEETAAAEPTQDSSATPPDLSITVEPATKPEEEGVREEKEDCESKNTNPVAKASEDAPLEDATEVKVTAEDELVQKSEVKDETVEEQAEEVEKKEKLPSDEPPKEKVNVNLELCRVCMGTDDLSDIFQLEGPVRISDIIMKVCTNIRITARDHLPHKICGRCLGQVRIVNEFKVRCEASDKELRKTLSRSSNKSRRQVIVVNCPMSDSENEEEPVDDDEYQVSQSEVESEPATSDDSFSPPNKRKRTPKKRGRKPTPGRRGRPGRKPKHMAIETPSVITPAPKRGPGRPPKNPPKTPSLANIVYIEAPEDSSSSDEGSEQKRRRRKRGDNPCPKCNEVLPSQHALKQHLKSHPADIYNCDRCTLWFRTQQALMNHIERHKKADRIRDEKRREREQRQDQRYRDAQRLSEPEERKVATQISTSTEKKKKLDSAPAGSGRDLFKI
uniref:Uncharacterized protein n=1 Tax=Anopheles atroparvus TaxID=41427 RepID=A0A182JBK8_ANOAO